LEKKKLKNKCIAFQGEDGAYSQEATFKTFGGKMRTLPCHTFEDIFRAVESDRADLGMLPIENSTAGAINQSYDLLLDRNLKISGEVIFRVHHALLAVKGVALENIKRVYSHPQALAQCERFIVSRGWEAISVHDTAGAARQLAASPETNAAAIASETAARLYGLHILAKSVEDLSNNFTRFFVIGKSELPCEKKSKTSIVFATKHIPGALYDCLGYLAARNINLTKIESRPDRRHPWHYVFYVDFDGHREDAICREMLDDLRGKASFLKVLGSYPAAVVSAESG
jgi:prephenate dehydratase